MDGCEGAGFTLGSLIPFVNQQAHTYFCLNQGSENAAVQVNPGPLSGSVHGVLLELKHICSLTYYSGCFCATWRG